MRNEQNGQRLIEIQLLQSCLRLKASQEHFPNLNHTVFASIVTIMGHHTWQHGYFFYAFTSVK